MLLASAPLAAWGLWALWVATQGRYWVTGLLGAAAIAVAFGLQRLQQWAKYAAYLFATTFVVTWVYALWLSIARGLWPYANPVRSVLSLIPGACFLAVCLGGVYVVHRQYAVSGRRGTERKVLP